MLNFQIAPAHPDSTTRFQRQRKYAEQRVLHWLARRNAASAAGKHFIADKCSKKAQNWPNRVDSYGVQS